MKNALVVVIHMSKAMLDDAMDCTREHLINPFMTEVDII